jgi:hypothetical protein
VTRGCSFGLLSLICNVTHFCGQRRKGLVVALTSFDRHTQSNMVGGETSEGGSG